MLTIVSTLIEKLWMRIGGPKTNIYKLYVANPVTKPIATDAFKTHIRVLDSYDLICLDMFFGPCH